jgi:hypothetical protein
MRDRENNALPKSPAHEQHYTLKQLVEKWEVSRPKLTEILLQDPDVIKIGYGYRRGKNGRVTLRIPFSVAERVHREMAEGKY